MEKVRKLIINTLKNKFFNYNHVLSLTIVGSFLKKNSLSVISDIDVVIIVDELNEKKYNEIISIFKTINGEECGLNDYSVKINPTFGPLKFSEENTIVFHVMIYDVKSHIQHVINSPFTTLDWELYESILGKNLNDFYNSFPVQMGDIISSRRGFLNYVKDIDKATINYRKYDFSSGNCEQKTMHFEVDEKHSYEYSFHVLKFLMLNIIKIFTQENSYIEEEKLIENFKYHFSDSFEFFDLFKKLMLYKNKKIDKFILKTSAVKKIISALQKEFENKLREAPKVSFVRHGKTVFNDGSFLGIGRDPDILKKNKFSERKFNSVFHSCLKRSKSTAELLYHENLIETDLLNEINYGQAEGLNLSELNKKFPKISQGWADKRDPCFPNGECQEDVKNRLKKFIKLLTKLSNQDHICVVTHNVVLRTLIGKCFKISEHYWYKLSITHLEFYDFILLNGKLIPNLTEVQRINFKKEIFLK